MVNTKGFSPETREWNDSLRGNYLWNNTNFGEAVTEVMTPLTWSLIQFTLADWVFMPGYPTVGIIGGFPYINISVFATLFNSMGRSQGDLLDFMESTLYMQLPDGMDIPLIDVPRWKLALGFVNAMVVQLRQQLGVRALDAYLAENLGWFKIITRRLRAVETRADLYTVWHQEMKNHIQKGVWCVLGSATHSTNYTMKLRRDLTEWVGSDLANVLIANLGDAIDPLASLGPVCGLAEVAEGTLSREAYMDRFGHRGPHEFELSRPRPAEDPGWFNQALADYQSAPVDIDALLENQRQAFETAWGEVQDRLPDKAGSIGRRIQEAARRARRREFARSAYIRDRWSVRIFALRAGELTGLGEDIFFLRLEEVLDLLQLKDVPADRITSRKSAYHRYQQLPTYPSLIKGPFDPFAWAIDPHRRTDIFDSQTKRVATQKDILAGSPGSAGQVEGVVRVLSSPVDGGSLQQGEILVAVQTDIAWTMIFPRAAAVITDVGAPLSHAAIVARELGIPAVVGCGDATMQLKTGDRVRVDGSRGTVTIMNHHR